MNVEGFSNKYNNTNTLDYMCKILCKNNEN